ncbi:MAG TPA: choice-of-anchor B family protein [Candidatus Eisenbacteria bacterium]
MPLFRIAPVALLSSLAQLTFVCTATSQVAMRNMELKAHVDEYPPAPGSWGYAACWSYVHADGWEYAVLGTRDGTAIYNVTNPASTYRVAFIDGPPSVWREAKSYRDWIYVVTEGNGPGEGLQIIRMTDPEHPVLAATYAVHFITSHTVSVDTSRALLVCNGTRMRGDNGYPYASGIHLLSLADPEAPTELGTWPNVAVPVPDTLYVHDSVLVGDRLYGSSMFAGVLRVLDISNPAAPAQIAAWHYPGAFTHNSWPDASGDWLYVTDEINGQPLKIFDIHDLDAPVLFNGLTSNPAAVVHNAHVKGNELYLSNYTEGIRILDDTDPAHPAEFAWADSWPGPSGGFNGVWEVCPYFPSGTVIASDMTTGLYVYRPIRNYGLLRVQVVDAGTGRALPGVKLFLSTRPESLTTALDGIAAFAPDPGTQTVLAHKFGYDDASVTRVVSAGSSQTVTIEMTAKPSGTFSGTVRNDSSDAPLADAELTLPYTPLECRSDGAGQFGLLDVPADQYWVEVRCPGYIPERFVQRIEAGSNVLDLRLVPAAIYDPLETETGWTLGAPGDQATSGIWTRVEPLGTGSYRATHVPGGEDYLAAGPFRAGSETGARRFHEGEGLPPGDVQPEYDRTPSPGELCYVTGQGTNPHAVGENCVAGGRTSLTTPPFDATGMTTPTVGFWRWFYCNGDRASHWLAVLISSDGETWVPVDTTGGLHNHWEEQEIRVADYVTPTSQVRVRFQAAAFGGHIVEAAIDDLTLYDAELARLGLPPPAGPTRLAFLAPRPNPARGTVQLGLDHPGGRLEVDILDLQGRRTTTLLRGSPAPGTLWLSWNGRVDGGHPAGAGLYWARARSGGEQAVVRFALLP